MLSCFIFILVQMEQTISSSSLRVTIQKVKRFCYILVLYALYEIMLHFLYSSCIQYYPDVAQEFDSWSWCGLAYSLSVMFYLKYFIIYSMAGSISSFENIELPPPPKCISCIHLSSYLWRWVLVWEATSHFLQVILVSLILYVW